MIVPTDNYRIGAKNEYKFVQENGQRKYGPPIRWSGSPPPKGCEIFIGKLPRDVYEDELMPLFEQIGPIYEFRLMIDFSGTTRGFAFAMYTNKEDARKAISQLNGYEIRPNKKIGVLLSVDNCKLFVGGIPTSKTGDDVFREISFLTEGVMKVCVLPCPYDHSKNRGFAFVEYESHRYASIARRVLCSGKLFNKAITVDWADPEPEIDEESLKETCTLYARNIPLEIGESCLKSIFSANGLGPVRKVRKVKDFAFVHYFVREDAEKALNQLNGTNLIGHVIEVTWAKPKTKHAEGSVIVQKKSRIKKEIEEWNTSQECPKHVMPQSFISTINAVQNTPVQVLEYVCIQSGYGEPYYLIYQSASSEILTFTSKVFIPYLPLWKNGFLSDGGFPSPFEAKCFAALKALKNIGFSDNDYHISEDSIIPAIKHTSCSSIASIPYSCSPIGLNVEQESVYCQELVKASSTYSDRWNFTKDDEIISSKKSDSVSIYDLLATAALLANHELQACSSKQK
ncbi:probable RNA-binding protein 46 [Argiope bruennichi]|uniref:probable RNA-binding protein 46 n=1 Tax=Argiope bruennichi TaxID=94029 RepID=UPI002493F931|nr:probable RNA-binding protein 46 [Argiope bruennichi]